MKKVILDACCGGRMFWFDKHHEQALYVDVRHIPKGCLGTSHPNFCVEPDEIVDFRDMPYPDKSFKLVVFDPPHLARAGDKSYMGLKYGVLGKDWKSDIKCGFDECMRVLDDYGTLIVKWNETHVTVSELLRVLAAKPLFGHTSGRNARTMWMAFMKFPPAA